MKPDVRGHNMIIQALVQASLWGRDQARARARHQLQSSPQQTRRITPSAQDKALLLLGLLMFLGASCLLTWVLLLVY